MIANIRFINGEPSEHQSDILRLLITDEEKNVKRLARVQEKEFVQGLVKCPSSWIAIYDALNWIDLAYSELESRGEDTKKSNFYKKIEKLNQTLNPKDFYKLKFTYKCGDKIFVYSYRNDGEKQDRVKVNCYDITNQKFISKFLGEMNGRSFLDSLQEFRLGSWKQNYNSFDYGVAILDGTSWRLELKYHDKKKNKLFCGMNAYPYNFRELLEFLEIDFDSSGWKATEEREQDLEEDDYLLFL